MNKITFEVNFEDGATFKGESYPNSNWNEMPNKKILGLKIKLGSKIFVFTGFTEYNHLKENINIMGKGSKVTKIMIMARNDEKTRIITYELETGKIYQNITNIGEEYGKQKLLGWKDGAYNERQKIYIN